MPSTTVVQAPVAVDAVTEAVSLSPAVVGEMIQERLGEVPNLKTIKVVKVAPNSFRVNVFVHVPTPGLIIPGNKIGYSYFVTMNDDGTIAKSNPPLPTEPFAKA